MIHPINNFTVIESVYGRFVVNRHCHLQADYLIKTGRPHIEPELRNILAVVETLPPECVVVDAGANIGLVCIPIAQALKARGGVVCAFEIQRMLFYALCGGAALNDLENLVVQRTGLGATRGVMKVPRLNYGAPQDFGQLSLVGQDEVTDHEMVEIHPIDQLGLPRLDFLKIDVEGMESEVLQGAQAMIHKFKPWCWVEYYKTEIPRIKEQFQGLDYKFFVMDDLNILCAPAERRILADLKVNAHEV